MHIGASTPWEDDVKNPRVWVATCVVAVACAAGPPEVPPVPPPGGLMCELMEHPGRVEITDARPEFSWIVNATGDDEVQTAYQVRVAATPAALERPEDCAWDSGKVASDRSVAVTYAGKPLESHRSYCWKVRIWDKRGTVGAWSDAQRFRTGVLGADTTARYPLVQTEVAPIAVVEKAKGHYFVDFGRAAFAALK